MTSHLRCGFTIDNNVLRATAGSLGLDFRSDLQIDARDAAFEKAGRKFSGLRGSPECAYALDRYGPDGTVFPWLILQAPEPD